MNREFRLALVVVVVLMTAFYLGIIRPYSHRMDEISKAMSKPPVITQPTPTPGVSL